MTLTLRAVSLNDQPLSQPITAHFDAQGGSIGRADHNTLALPDPERHISRQHAEIIARNDGYLIRNVGSANPIIVRGQALTRGESAPLMHHDQVRIGGYVLEVVHEGPGDDDEAGTIIRGRAEVDARTPGVTRRAAHPAPPSSPAGVDLAAPLSSSNPFADLLGDPLPVIASPRAQPGPPPVPRAVLPPADFFHHLPPAAAGIAPSSVAWASPSAGAPHAVLPDDFDPFAPPTMVPSPSARPSSARAGVFDDLIPRSDAGGDSESIDRLFDLKPTERDPLADFLADASPRKDRSAGSGTDAAGLSSDPFAMFGDPPADVLPSRDAPPAVADHTPALAAAFKPPRPRAVQAEPPPRARVEPVRAAPEAGDADGLWRAFCEGAGLPDDPSRAPDADTLRAAGAMLRAAVAGTLQLMAVRATTKHELRAQVTVIQAQANNPLKFSPDANSAIDQMLRPAMRGFLAGPEAMSDAMHDLIGHTIGTMAGTRAALEGVLDRFTPQALEAKLVGKSMLDTLLPMNRKAKLWELYLHHFETIRTEAQDDFHTLFGKAFLAAYEQQLDRLFREDASSRS